MMMMMMICLALCSMILTLVRDAAKLTAVTTAEEGSNERGCDCEVMKEEREFLKDRLCVCVCLCVCDSPQKKQKVLLMST